MKIQIWETTVEVRNNDRIVISIRWIGESDLKDKIAGLLEMLGDVAIDDRRI
jgi:hypothetical protein